MEGIKIHKLVRSKRRTIALVIEPDATLTVRAPFGTPISYIEQAVSEKISWIGRKIGEMRSRPAACPREYVEGESFLFLGEPYRLSFADGARRLQFRNGFTVAEKNRQDARKLLMSWYKRQARKMIAERVAWHSRVLGLPYGAIRITGARKRWGSCSHNGNLNFSWRLVMAPFPVIDYVVVHELAHLEEKNHSRRFWNKVKGVLPDYKIRNKWLRENEYQMFA